MSKIVVDLLFGNGVSNPFVTIDAGETHFLHRVMLEGELLIKSHVLDGMTVPAFTGVGRSHRVPYALGHQTTMILKFLAGIYGADDLVIDILNRQYLGNHLWHKHLWYMAIGTARSHPCPVFVMYAFGPLRLYVRAHRVTRGAEFGGACCCHCEFK